MTSYLITGANRGIGLEVARRLSQRGDEVIAAVRQPESADALRALPSVRIEALDVEDESSIAALADRLRGRSIDVLINNAGVQRPDMTLDQVGPGVMDLCFHVNAAGPLLLTQALLVNLRAGRGRTVVNILLRTSSGTAMTMSVPM